MPLLQCAMNDASIELVVAGMHVHAYDVKLLPAPTDWHPQQPALCGSCRWGRGDLVILLSDLQSATGQQAPVDKYGHTCPALSGLLVA